MGRTTDSYNIQLDYFSNGDILLADSDITTLGAGQGGRLLLTRLDNCGEELWSKSYQRPEYLELHDMQLGPDDKIYVFGSAFTDFAELIFLSKMHPDGTLDKFTVYRTETVDRFSYALDVTRDQILVNGLLLDFSTQKEGFIGVFDLNLNLKWAKRFSPFESSGNAVFTDTDAIMGWSGPFVYKLDPDGRMEWLRILSGNGTRIAPVAGPVPVSDGAFYTVARGQIGHVIKLGPAGNLIWSSEPLPMLPKATDLSLWHNELRATVVPPSAPTTEIRQYFFHLDGTAARSSLTLDLGSTYFPERWDVSLHDTMMAVASLGAPGAPNRPQLQNFVMVVPQSFQPSSCFSSGNMPDQSNSRIDLTLMSVDTPSFSTTFTPLEEVNTPAEVHQTIVQEDLCGSVMMEPPVRRDSVLDCGQTWTVVLPPDYSWEDDLELPSMRRLASTGLYRATNRNCLSLEQLEYSLTLPDCSCPIYLPNSFTPNGDGRNDSWG
nr:hypothetical protein [Saprospiraceae bacterium]